MELDRERLDRLQQALCAAFPNVERLGAMVQTRLATNLEEIAVGNLRERVYGLIVWAEAQGRLDDLLRGARAEAPESSTLAYFFASLDPIYEVPPAPYGKRHFVGRERELEALREALVESQSTVTETRRALIRGEQGTGKIALAREFAEENAGAFPGGVLWAEVATRTRRRPTTSEDAGGAPSLRLSGEPAAIDLAASGGRLNLRLNAVLFHTLERWEARLGGVYVANRPIASLLASVRRRLMDHLVARGRCLVVLVHADDSTTLMLLFSVLAGCTVLVTTDRQSGVDIEGAPVFELSGLDRKESLTRFADELGEQDPRLAALDPLLGYVGDDPFVVGLLIPLLRASDDVTPAAVLAALERRAPATASATERLGATIRYAIEQLPRGSHRPLLMATAVLSPESWPAEAADYVAGVCDEASTLTTLDQLRARGFIEALGGSRYRVNAMLRDHLTAAWRREGLHWLRPTWEIAALPWWLVHLGADVLAGQATYALRQETYFLRRAWQRRDDPAALRADWSNLVLAVTRRIHRRDGQVLRTRLSLLGPFLRGADLSHAKLPDVVLDGASLDQANLEGAQLAGDSLRRLPTREDIRRAVRPLVLAAAGSTLSMAAAVAVLVAWLKVTPSTWVLVLLGPAIVLAEHAARLVLRAGAWFDRARFGARVALERMAVALAVLIGVGLAVWPATWTSGWPLHEVLIVFGAPAFLVGPVLGVAATTSFPLVRWSIRQGLGGLARRASLCAALWAVLALLALGTLALIDAVASASGQKAPLFALAASLVIAVFFGGLRAVWLALSGDPDAGIAVYSIRTSYLRGASLVGANLCGARLDRVRLHGANLAQAQMDGAYLVEAVLVRASLRGASLVGARLCGADLCRADLRGANLRGADLEGARLFETRLEGVDYDKETRWPRGFVPPPRVGDPTRAAPGNRISDT